MRPRSRRGPGTVVRVGLVVAALTLPGSPGVFAAEAGAQSPEVVVITEGDLDWSVSETGSMTWMGFGSRVSEDPECRLYPIGGPVTSIRFELQFDLGDDPPTLTGTLLGTMEWQNPAVQDPAYGQEWASGSFSGPIVDGWARETGEGWAWGGNANLTLDFTGLRICSIFLDESLAEDYIVAEGNGQRQVTVRFDGGPGAYGEDSGFSLDGSVGTWQEGEDSWGIALGCNGCDIPLPLPVDSGGIAGADAGEEPGGESSVSSAAQPPAAGGETPADDDEDLWTALLGNEGTDQRRGWSPLGVLILILLLVALVGVTVPLAVQTVLSGLARRRDFPLTGQFTSRKAATRKAATLADSAQAHRAWDAPGSGGTFTVREEQELRLGPGEQQRGIGTMLKPGQPYEITGVRQVGDPQATCDRWYEVRLGDQIGWVPHNATEVWSPRWTAMNPSAPSSFRPPPTPTPAREVVEFTAPFETRDPVTGNVHRELPGRYRLGPPDAHGHRPVYPEKGKTPKLLGTIHQADVPSPSGKPIPPPPPPTPAP